MASSSGSESRSPGSRGAELSVAADRILEELEETHRAREEGLARSRETIRACSLAIRALHRRRPDDVARQLSEAEQKVRAAQAALQPFPRLAAMGFLHDAEKEYAEARLTQALIDGDPLPTFDDLQVGIAAWLNGLAEAASELRRHLLDCLRTGDVDKGVQLLERMEEVYDMLVTVEYPDAITGGLRRAVDALRAVLERSRADVTTTVLQTRLQRAIESRGPSD